MSLAKKIQTLYEEYGKLNGISIECQKELIAIGIRNQAAKAEIFLQGAQVSAYERHGERPILFLSDACEYRQGSSLRGGIPICWPWFGDLDKNPEQLKNQYPNRLTESMPAHGFVREQEWTLKHIEIKGTGETVVTLALDVPPSDQWPFRAQLLYKVIVGESLSVSLSVKNTGACAFYMSAALHSYFSVKHIQHASIGGLDQAQYVDALQNWATFKQDGDVAITQEVDRIYFLPTTTSPLSLKDDDRTIHLRSGGSQTAVVWNPWIEKSQRLSQFNDDDYQTMLCIETANVLDDAIQLQPNARHVLGLTIY